MARKKLKSAADQRPFSIIYHDFLDSDLLNTYEKMVFIALKKFADSNNQCFPSLKKLADVTKMSKRKIQDTLKALEQKHIIGVKSRFNVNNGHTSNLYTLYDFKEVWDSSSSEAEAIDKMEEKRMIDTLTAKGYCVTKEKVPDTEPFKEQNQAPQLNQIDIVNTTTNPEENQASERYTLEQIRQLFDYDIMLHDYPLWKHDIDAVMNILHTAMNTNKNIRAAGADRPCMVVIGRLMKLNKESIMYAIEKFSKQTDRINNPASYMLTILYMAPDQYYLDIKNQVAHDMSSINRMDN